MRTVHGKVAFITGGVSGIGLGMARAFVAAGMKVVLTYLRDGPLSEARQYFEGLEHQVLFLRMDVTNRSAFQLAADEAERAFGKVHILCNNAGVNQFISMDAASSQDWDWILGVNLGGVINGLLTFLPRIKAHGEGGHIVNVASMAAMLPGPEAGVYTTSKIAVRGLSECLQYALAPHRIGVSVFCPGLVKSRIYESSLNRPPELSSPITARKDEAFRPTWKAMQDLGMDPVLAGRMVLEGIQTDRLFIFSQTDLKEDLGEYFKEILSAFPDVLPDPRGELIVESRRRWIEAMKQLIRTRSEGNDAS